jgi:hypothetical protein
VVHEPSQPRLGVARTISEDGIRHASIAMFNKARTCPTNVRAEEPSMDRPTSMSRLGHKSVRTEVYCDKARTPPRLHGSAPPERCEPLRHGVQALAVEPVAVDHRSAVDVATSRTVAVITSVQLWRRGEMTAHNAGDEPSPDLTSTLNPTFINKP